MSSEKRISFNKAKFIKSIEDVKHSIENTLACDLQMDLRLEISSIQERAFDSEHEKELIANFAKEQESAFRNYPSKFVQACKAYTFYKKNTDLNKTRSEYIADFYQGYIGRGVTQEDIDNIEQEANKVLQLEFKSDTAKGIYQTLVKSPPEENIEKLSNSAVGYLGYYLIHRATNQKYFAGLSQGKIYKELQQNYGGSISNIQPAFLDATKGKFKKTPLKNLLIFARQNYPQEIEMLKRMESDLDELD